MHTILVQYNECSSKLISNIIGSAVSLYFIYTQNIKKRSVIFSFKMMCMFFFFFYYYENIIYSSKILRSLHSEPVSGSSTSSHGTMKDYNRFQHKNFKM